MMKEQRITHHCDNKTLLTDQVAAAQIRLRDRLAGLNIKSLGISEYNKRYLGEKIPNIEGTLEVYGRLLYLSCCRSSHPLDRFVLVDYGGGSGVLSFLAKELGIGTVIYNDIYEASCTDVRLLSKTLGLHLDHVVYGDIDELISYLRVNSISVDAITCFDVLEHIYNVEYHFKRLAAVSERQFRVVYASTANLENPWYMHAVTRKQIDAEYKNREEKFGHKERDCLRAFFDVRKQMISTYAPGLSSEEVEQLSRFTRGLIKSDIEKCVDEYRQTGSITYRPEHPTNTCDPYTGNWCEHLMWTGWLQQVLEDEGFSVEILAGYYPKSGSVLKKGIKLCLNVAIRLLGRRSMFIAPYYVVYADRLAEQSE